MIQGILQVAVLLIRTSLAAVLVAAGAAKLADIRSFTTTLIGLGIPIRPGLLIRGLALIVPLVEVGLGIAMVSGLLPKVINSAVLVLMCGFSLVVIVALARKVHVTCRCFGILSDSQFSSKGLARSLFLTLLAVAIFWSGNVYSPQFNGPPGVILLLVAGFLLFAVAAAQAAKSIAVLKERAM